MADKMHRIALSAMLGIRYRVSGFGQFPVDMLRYDRAWPASEIDAGTIHASFRNVERWSVSLEGLDYPTVERWRSFGCEVEGS